MIYCFVADHRHEFRVSKMCSTLGVSKSGFYEWMGRTDTPQKHRKEKMKNQIRQIHKQSKGRYGSPKITAILRQNGMRISERTVTRYMKEMGLRSNTVKKYKATTHSKHNLPVYPNLLNQHFTVSQRGEVWVSDITYVHTQAGWLYLATVMDLFSRRIIGWAMSDRMTKALVIRALKRAFQTQTPTPGLIHHSDRGSQYAALDYQALLRAHGIRTSMSRKGNCYDNACIESFHSIIKKELIHHENYATRTEASMSILEYIVSFYNYERIHSYLNYLSPIEFEKRYA